MPFDNQPDFEVSDELSPLAEQLAADAARLEATFPARPMSEALAVALAAAQPPSRRTLQSASLQWRSAAAVVLAGVALCSAWAWQAGLFQAAAPGDNGLIDLPVNEVRFHPDDHPAIHKAPAAGWFDNYDSSEQEGVLDLIEREQDDHDETISL